MREGSVVLGYQIILMDLFKSEVFSNYPSVNQMKEFVSKHFPTFHANGDRVTWKVEEVHFLED